MGGIRAKRSVSPAPQGVTTSAQRVLRVMGANFPPKKSKGSPLKRRGTATKGPQRGERSRKWAWLEEVRGNEKGGQRAGHRVDSPWT